MLFHDAKAGVIGAAHAGHRGAKLGVLQNTLAAMEDLGAQRQDICAVIGPCISQKAYEVGPEFLKISAMMRQKLCAFSLRARAIAISLICQATV